MSEPIHPAAEDTDALAIENAIFETALQIQDLSLRHAFLDKTYQGDPVGREEMEDLIKMAGTSSAFFLEGRLRTAKLAQEVIEDIPGEVPPPPCPSGEKEGSRIGRYTLVRKIAEGGCGEIFEAVPEGMVRTVALKIIRSGMDTETVVSRFESERKTLEMLDHPHIARVLDAGKTTGGRPYFVMELVRGSRITELCESAQLDIEARLKLFLKICQAIQHAHQKGIVHRDIKPSNILVDHMDGNFVPKVIDFGIAKAMQTPSPGREGITLIGQFIGTPAYMSPEQIDMGGMDIDTRADIYGLGALLYELLTGRPPFDMEKLGQAGVTEMRRTLMEDYPPRPSEVVRFRNVGERANALPGPRDKWANMLRGEIDWIVIRAMEKERDRRYQTVNSLSMDIQRYLRNEPVIARKPSRWYFLSKFLQRNRAACVSGVAMLLSLLVGLGTTTALYFREKEALAEQARLQRQVQARANVSLAAILLSEGNKEEADLLLRKDPLESIDASPEAAEVFRALGRWNAVFGRWPQAANCFRLMNEANRLADPARVAEGMDLLMTAPSYVEAGDKKSYEDFRSDALNRYLPTQSAIQAEHVIKACLLLPADEATMRKLEDSARACRENLPGKSGAQGLPGWNALSLSLLHYRKAEYEEAIRQAETSLTYRDDVGSKSSAARCILAMSRFRVGEVKEARRQLQLVKSTLHRVESQIDDTGFPPIGNWFAWSVVRILKREAEATLAA